MDQTQSTTEEDSQAAEAREDRLQVFSGSLAKLRDEWVRSRQASGWDRRISADLDQYHMRDAATRMASSMMDSVQQGQPVTVRNAMPTRSTVFVGVTRQKTNAAEARLSDIVLPTDDKNYGIQPTPDPEGVRAMKDDTALIDPATGRPVLVDAEGNVTDDPDAGQPLTKKQVAIAAEKAASAAAEAMLKLIDDQLVESDYNSEIRKALHDAAVMGTGVIKGPVANKRVRKAWRERADPATGKKIQVLQLVEEIKPATFRVDPRMVWEDPECGDNVQDGRGVFELERLTEKKVRDLAKQPGYLKPQLKQAIEDGPKQTSTVNFEQLRQDSERESLERTKTFEHWIYWGELDIEDLKAAGVAVPEGEDDELVTVSGCVEMINDIVVRAYLNPLDDGSLPYDFYPWEKVQGCVRGYGVPYLMRAQQSVINAAWRQMMDNNGVTAGPQIIVNRRAVNPQDNQWALRPFKFWDLTDDGVDPSKVFHAVEFNNHQEHLAAVLELAEKIADQETATPMLAQGQQGSAPDTVGGMQLLMNSANVVLRRLVKQFDDYITKPHIRRYYDYNMAYSEDEEVKGDFQIDARGSSALLVRDIQNQAYTNMLAAGANPIYTPLINPKKLFEKALQAQHIDPKDILNSDEEIKANQERAAQQTDPRIESAKINAEARLREANAIAEGRAVETAVTERGEVENRKLRVRELELKREIAILTMANARAISIDQIKASLAQVAIGDRTKKELAAAEMTFKTTTSPDQQGI